MDLNNYTDDESDHEEVLSSVDYISARPAIGQEQGNITDGGVFEQLDQDDFTIQPVQENISTDEVISIPYNLSVVPDVNNTVDINPITEKCDRFGNISATLYTGKGGSLGKYTIEPIVPTTIRGQIEHIDMPADAIAATVMIYLGFSSILSMAGSALSSFGGPLLSGIVNTAIPGGGALLGVGSKLLGGLLGGLGSKPSDSNQSNESADPVGITGDLSISRFMNFIKPNAPSEALDPKWGTILMKAKNLIGYNGEPLTSLPVNVFMKMIKPMLERNLYDRTTIPSLTMVNKTVIPVTELPVIMAEMSTYMNAAAFRKFAVKAKAEQALGLKDLESLFNNQKLLINFSKFCHYTNDRLNNNHVIFMEDIKLVEFDASIPSTIEMLVRECTKA